MFTYQSFLFFISSFVLLLLLLLEPVELHSQSEAINNSLLLLLLTKMDVFTFLLDNAMLIYNFYLSILMVQKLREPSLTLLCMLVISAAAVISSYHMAFAQGNQQQQQQPKANIINSKYMTIKDQRFRNEQFSNSITGTIVNNSTQQMESIHAYVILYNKNNRVIALENALADVSTLNPGDDSAFKISLYGLDIEPIDHYTLIPSGTLPASLIPLRNATSS